MSVLEARFEGLSRAHRAVIGLFATLCVTVVGGAAAIILTSGGPH